METTRRILLGAPAVLLPAGCNSTGPNASQRISLSARTGSAGAPAATGAALADVVVTGSGGSVKITSAQMVLSRIKLASDAACTATSDTDAHEPNDTPAPETNTPTADNHDQPECPSTHAGPARAH